MAKSVVIRLIIVIVILSYGATILTAHIAGGSPELLRTFAIWSVPAYLMGIGTRDLLEYLRIVYARTHDSHGD